MHYLTARKGNVMLVAIIFIGIFTAIGTALLSYTTAYARFTRVTVANTQALALAEAGIDKAAYELNTNPGYTGETGTALGAGTFSVDISTIDTGKKRITATAYVPNQASPVATKTVSTEVSIDTSIVSFRFGVQVGAGGLTMGSHTNVTGNMFSDGSIIGGDDANISGDATVAGGTDPAPDQQWSTQNSSMKLGDASARADLAQGFTPSVSKKLNSVSLYLKKSGSPGDISIRIVTDNAGSPSKTVLASGTLPASSVTSSYGFASASLSTNPSLTAGTRYWIILIAPAVSSSNYFTWGGDSGNGYAGGSGKSSSNWNATNPVWSSALMDFDFAAYMGGTTTTLSGVDVGGTAWAQVLQNCTVGGNAVYTTMSGCTVRGTKTAGADPASPEPMPITDAQIAEWEAAAAAGGIIAGPYTLTGNQVLGPKEVAGDLTVNGTLTLSGPVWVKGNIIFANNSTLTVDVSAGNKGAILIADNPSNPSTSGLVDLSNNVAISGNGNAGSFPMVLSTNTSTNAISMSNNASSVILYASKGTINVSNNAAANQITAYALNMNNNADVNYVTGLANQSFSNGPGGSWAFVPGTYSVR